MASDNNGSPKKSKLGLEGALSPHVKAEETKPKPKVPFSQSTVDYLNNWFQKNLANPYPTQQEKLIIMASTGLNKRQLSDWLSKARKKHANTIAGTTSANASKTLPKADSNSDKLENLLLQLKGTLPTTAQISQGQSNVNAKASVIPAVQTGQSFGGNTIPVVVAKKSGTPSKDKPKFAATPSPNNNSTIGLSEDAKRYLEKWIQEHKHNPFPARDQKERMMKDLGLGPDDLRKLDGWFSRARKKLKNDPTAPKFYANKIVPGKPSPVDVEKYLNAWLLRPENANNLNPTYDQRAKMEDESGIESRRIESWFYRLRKKMKKQQDGVNDSSQKTKAALAPTSTGVAHTKPISAQNPSTGLTQPKGTSAANPSTGVAQRASDSVPNKSLSNSAQNVALNQVSQSVPQGNQPNQGQNVQSTSNTSSNLDLLFEAASIHSAAKEAAKEAYNKMEREVIASQAQNNPLYSNNVAQFSQSSQRQSHPTNPNASYNEENARFAQGNQMRLSPVFCQPVQNQSVSSRGPSPPNNYNPQQAYRDRRPSAGFVPIHADNQHYRPTSRGPTPTYPNATPYQASGPIRYGDQYQRASPTYMNMQQHASQQQGRYPRPPDNVQYHQSSQYQQQYPRYNNMHNGQQDGSQHQR